MCVCVYVIEEMVELGVVGCKGKKKRVKLCPEQYEGGVDGE